LNEAKNQSLSEAFINHGGSGKFDFVANQPSDTFTVNRFTYNAGQFGNFLAGYTGAYLGGFFGYSGVRFFGIAYDFDEEGFDFDWAAESVPFIQDGAAIAEFEKNLCE